VPASQYPGARFADAASWLVDQERYAAFTADGAHHESRYYLTFLYLPPPKHEGRAERLLYERTETGGIEVEPHAQLEWFVTETDRAFQMLGSIPPLMMAETRGGTPFRLDLHVGDVGHTLVVGPTGAGKSVLLSLLALQFRRFIGAQVILFDRSRSARAATLAMGGASIELGLEGTPSLQPLARIDEPDTEHWRPSDVHDIEPAS
jgi:type IV secretory pathway VirB4 component